MPQTIDQIIQAICEKMTDGPVDVKITESSRTLILEIHVPPEQCGRIIGGSGRTITSLRIIAQAMGVGKKRVLVEVCEPGDD